MTPEEFSFIVDRQLQVCQDVLVDKARQYAPDDDRLHNFRVAAVLRGSNIVEVIAGMMVKHTISIYDMINSGQLFPLELWEEKITDHINYLLLLRAALHDENPGQTILTWDETSST
jgi:hypothetical protein